MMIGVQASDNGTMIEKDVLSHFIELGLSHDEDYVQKGQQRFSYFVAEDANYLIFREENDIDFFTENVISFLKSFDEEGKITVREEDEIEEDGYLFIGSVKQFLNVWDSV